MIIERTNLHFPNPLPDGSMGLPPKSIVGPCAMGCDVRPGSYDVSIVDIQKPRPDMKIPRLVFYGKVRDENEVAWLAQQYPVRVGIVDCRPDGTVIDRFVKRMNKLHKNFWRVQYNPNSASAIEMSFNEANRLITLHRTMAIDEVFFAVSNTAMAIPENFRDICSGLFAREMCNSTRTAEINSRGEESYSWSKGDDHALHSLAYSCCAVKIGKLNTIGSDSNSFARGIVESTFGKKADPMDIADDMPEEDEGMSWSFDAGF